MAKKIKITKNVKKKGSQEHTKKVNRWSKREKAYLSRKRNKNTLVSVALMEAQISNSGS